MKKLVDIYILSFCWIVSYFFLSFVRWGSFDAYVPWAHCRTTTDITGSCLTEKELLMIFGYRLSH